jgi:hypothetical protein
MNADRERRKEKSGERGRTRVSAEAFGTRENARRVAFRTRERADRLARRPPSTNRASIARRCASTGASTAPTRSRIEKGRRTAAAAIGGHRRASRSVRAGSGRRDASPTRETYHGVCAATVSRSRRTARVSRAARVCAGAEEDRATRVGSVRLRREIRDGSCMKSVTKDMYKGYKIDTVSKGCRMWCSVCVRAMLTKYQSHPETRLTSYRTSSCVSATSRPFSPPST